MRQAGPGPALNLPALAASAAGEPLAVPGGPFVVQELRARSAMTGTGPRWLLVLSGEVIVDLPGGDFRVLRRGDALHFPEGEGATLSSVAAPAVLVWHASR